MVFHFSQSRDKPGEAEAKPLDVNNRANPTKRGDTDAGKTKVGNEAMVEKFMNRAVRLEVEKDLHRVIIKLIDKKSGEVIRQIPPEELVELAKKMKEREGIFLRKEV